jgi:hypothetical protein
VGCRNSIVMPRQFVLVDEPAEQVAAVHLKSLGRRVRSDGCAAARVGRSQVECAVRSSVVVVTDVYAEDVFELASAEDQQPVEALPADASDPALHVRVRVRGLDGCADDFDPLATEEGVEGARELRVAVVDQEPHLPLSVVEIHQQVARLLQHPGGVRFAGGGEVLGAAAANGEEDEHVQAAQPDGVDGEEVAGEDRLAMRS